MANHVNSYLQFTRISEEGIAKLNELYARFDKQREEDYEVHLGAAFVDDVSEMDRGTACELIGAKWAYATDYDEGGMAMYSAWRAPFEFVEHVVDQIATVDKSVVAVLTYEDEMPNFIGFDIYTEEGNVEGCILEDDEIREELMDSYQDIAEQWDEEEEWWKDDGELYHDQVWDFVHEWQSENVGAVINDYL